MSAKNEFVAANPGICATIVQDLGYIQKECKHHYRSLVIRGNIEVLQGDEARWTALDAIIDQLEEEPEAVQVWRLHIDEISCKEGT